MDETGDPQVDRKKTIVGKHYERRGHRILGGTLKCNKSGDIHLEDLDVWVEVKGTFMQSQFGFRLSVQQIERNESNLLFGPNGVWYLFFVYDNKSRKHEAGRRVTELSRHTTQEAIGRYLASHTLWAVLVDFSIVTAWRDKITASTTSQRGRHESEPSVDVKCRRIYALANGGLREELEALGLDPKQYRVLTSTTSKRASRGGKASFPLTAVLPRASLKCLEARLQSRGFATTKKTV